MSLRMEASVARMRRIEDSSPSAACQTREAAAAGDVWRASKTLASLNGWGRQPKSRARSLSTLRYAVTHTRAAARGSLRSVVALDKPNADCGKFRQCDQP